MIGWMVSMVSDRVDGECGSRVVVSDGVGGDRVAEWVVSGRVDGEG